MCACVVHLYRFKLPTEAGWGIPCDETRGDSVGGNKIDQIVVAVELHHLFFPTEAGGRKQEGVVHRGVIKLTRSFVGVPKGVQTHFDDCLSFPFN